MAFLAAAAENSDGWVPVVFGPFVVLLGLVVVRQRYVIGDAVAPYVRGPMFKHKPDNCAASLAFWGLIVVIFGIGMIVAGLQAVL